MKGKRLVLLGYPGSGKGTVASNLHKKYGLTTISTGDILREEIAMRTKLGRHVSAILETGALVPDETMMAEVVEPRLSAEDILQAGFVLDGFPRTIP
ncbi:MAG: adenylate kinase family protein, partial [bacterium]